MIPVHTPKTPPTILLWVDEGHEPSEAAFDLEVNQAPPSPNPEGWWFLSEALEYAANVIAAEGNAGKVPWIRSGEAYLNPDQVRQFYKVMVEQRRRAQNA